MQDLDEFMRNKNKQETLYTIQKPLQTLWLVVVFVILAYILNDSMHSIFSTENAR